MDTREQFPEFQFDQSSIHINCGLLFLKHRICSDCLHKLRNEANDTEQIMRCPFNSRGNEITHDAEEHRKASRSPMLTQQEIERDEEVNEADDVYVDPTCFYDFLPFRPQQAGNDTHNGTVADNAYTNPTYEIEVFAETDHGDVATERPIDLFDEPACKELLSKIRCKKKHLQNDPQLKQNLRETIELNGGLKGIKKLLKGTVAANEHTYPSYEEEVLAETDHGDAPTQRPIDLFDHPASKELLLFIGYPEKHLQTDIRLKRELREAFELNGGIKGIKKLLKKLIGSREAKNPIIS